MIQTLEKIGDVGRFLGKEAECFVVYDRNVAWVADEVMEALPIKAAMSLETSEELKTMDSVLALERWLLEADASRGAILLAIGGGITTDLVGFAASLYKRGIRYANLPTTLLAQVDAAIGGKTGVNLDHYKNMLGAFRMPEYTFLCADVLRTLPPREFRNGMAELLKTFLLADAEAYRKALGGVTPELIARAAAIKADIVERDPEEHGERAKLNLGHTFGHAIEYEARLKGDDIAHGEAVAMGIILAARLSEQLKTAENGLAEALKQDFEKVGLPTQCPYPLESLKAAMGKDKKAQGGGTVKFVLPVTPGKVVFQALNPYDLHLDTA
jgi:3-dehydroquinate synthetase